MQSNCSYFVHGIYSKISDMISMYIKNGLQSPMTPNLIKIPLPPFSEREMEEGESLSKQSPLFDHASRRIVA